MSENKMYKVIWNYLDSDIDGITEDYAFIPAENEQDAVSGIQGVNIVVREATLDEAMAYVAGYDNGYDSAIITEKLSKLNLDDLTEISIEDLSIE